MPSTFVTFGQIHTHRVNGRTFDCDCVAVIECTDAEDGRRKAFEYFGQKFCFTYYEEQFDHDSLRYFPRGLIHVGRHYVSPEVEPARGQDGVGGPE